MCATWAFWLMLMALPSASSAPSRQSSGIPSPQWIVLIDDPLGDRLPAGFAVIDGALRERLVAGDEDQLQIVRRRAPRQFAQRPSG